MVRLSVQLVLAASLASFVAAVPVRRSKVFSVPVHAPKFVGWSAKDIVVKDKARHSKDASASGTIPVTNNAVSYLAVTTVNNQTFNLIVDSGSSNTWVGAGTTFDTSGATDTGHPVSVSYGSGAFSGEEYLASVSLSDALTVSNQSIGVATSSYGFTGVDGILGIGPVDLTEDTVTGVDTVPTIIDNLFSQGSISSDVIGISFAPVDANASTLNGELDFGGVDPSKFSGSLTYAPQTTNEKYSQFWAVEVSSTGYAGSPIKLTNQAIVDTGTTLILLPKKAYDAFLSATGGTDDSDIGLASFPSPPTEDLTFTIAGTVFSLSPSQYLIPESDYSLLGLTEGTSYAWVGNGGTTSEVIDYILGQKFIENFYIAFDTTNQQIGIAPRA